MVSEGFILTADNIISPVLSTIILAVLGYFIKTNRDVIKITKEIMESHDKYNRILFGEKDIEEWEGVIAMLFEVKKCTKDNKRALRIILNKLIENNLIDKNEHNIKCIYDILNND